MDAMASTLREGGTTATAVKGAVPAGDAVVADYLLPRLLARGDRPALVVLEISPETLARPSPWITDHTIRFFGWRDVASRLPEILSGDRTSRALAARLTPIHVYRRELLTWLTGRAPPYLAVPPAKPSVASSSSAPVVARADASAPDAVARGDVDAVEAPPADPEAAPRPRRVAATLRGVRQTARWLRHYRPDGAAALALDDVVARCREAGVPLVLVGVPVSSRVRALYTPEVERAFADVVERARRGGAEFVDYRATVPDRLFADHHHLNDRGSTVFAQTLAREVLAPRLAHHGTGL
jgi:hypothetical protein